VKFLQVFAHSEINWKRAYWRTPQNPSNCSLLLIVWINFKVQHLT